MAGYHRYGGGETRPRLVYDSHEFAIGISNEKNTVKPVARFWVEHFLIKKSDYMIVVNDEIGKQVKQIHHMKKPPLVVRNMPPNWKIDDERVKRRRREICESMGWSTNDFIIMYHGMIDATRKPEILIQAVARNKDIKGIILGNYSTEKDKANVLELIQGKNLEGRIWYHKAVKQDDLYEYVGAADAGLVILSKDIPNHRMALPNKFFENIQSGTPLIVPGFVEMRRLVEKYELGVTTDIEDSEALDSTIRRLVHDRVFCNKLRANARKAKPILCWEMEKRIIEEMYHNLSRNHEKKQKTKVDI